MRRRDIREGMVFTVPLRDGRYALGVVCRHSRSAVTVGYFFGPATDRPPALPESLDPADAAMVARFGDIPLVEDQWEVLGTLPGWDRTAWPATTFVRGDMRERGYVVSYDDKDPNKVVAERRWTAADGDLPSDDLHGYVIVRNRLSERLDRAGQDES